MPFTPPTGSGILLCPTGVGFSTISDEEFEALKNNELYSYGIIEGVIEQIDSEVYQEWLANAKEIEDSISVKYTPATEDYVDFSSSEIYKQGIIDPSTLTSLEFNTSPHPLPMMNYAQDRLYFKPDLSAGSQSGLDNGGNAIDLGFGYYRLPAGTSSQIRSLPYLFIRNDNFYWFNPKIVAEAAFEPDTIISATLSNTEYKWVYKIYLDYLPDGAPESIIVTGTVTQILRITKRFY